MDRGLVVLGCGKMGQALVQGWLTGGLDPQNVWILDPNPAPCLKDWGVHVNTALPQAPWGVMIAVKPQMMGEALPQITRVSGEDTVFLSIAAGVTLSHFEEVLGKRPIIRSMPNTPAAIGQGITAIVGNARVTEEHLTGAEALLSAVGEVLRVETEAQIDAVTGVSGSGPAYVFHLIETLAAAGEAEGLPAQTAMRLAKATVAGAGALAFPKEADPSQLRVNVTSPGGTTQAALEVLMDAEKGFPRLLPRAVRAAVARAGELSKGEG